MNKYVAAYVGAAIVMAASLSMIDMARGTPVSAASAAGGKAAMDRAT